MSDHATSQFDALPQANNHMAVELMKLLGEEGVNVFFSPFSLSTALAMLYIGTTAETAQEMRKALGYDAANLADEKVVSSYHQLLTAMEENHESYVLSCANSIIRHKDFAVKEAYKSLVSSNFKALMLDADFSANTEKVLKQINSWVSEKTQKKIPQLLESLDPATVMVLLNAVYFKGTWMRKFDSKLTQRQQFYNNGIVKKSKNVDMMHVKGDYCYFENDRFKALQMPYKGEEVAMMILLPHELNGVKELESEMSDSFFQELKKGMRKIKVEVALPKFNMEYSKSLPSYFYAMGVKKIFKVGADFDNITDCKLIVVTDIIHKAVFEMNEEGSEAAAATAVIMAVRSAPRIRSFVANHPFIFTIYDTRTDLILFMGKVEQL